MRNTRKCCSRNAHELPTILPLSSLFPFLFFPLIIPPPVAGPEDAGRRRVGRGHTAAAAAASDVACQSIRRHSPGVRPTDGGTDHLSLSLARWQKGDFRQWRRGRETTGGGGCREIAAAQPPTTCLSDARSGRDKRREKELGSILGMDEQKERGGDGEETVRKCKAGSKRRTATGARGNTRPTGVGVFRQARPYFDVCPSSAFSMHVLMFDASFNCRLPESLCSWFGEFCSCCCLPPPPQLACSILATTYKPFSETLYL